MRLALVTNNRFPPREGVARHVLEIGRRLARRGHGVTVLARGAASRTSERNLDGLRIVERPDVMPGPAGQIADRLALGRWLEANAARLDLLHVHLPLLPPLPTRLPLAVTVHSPMLTDAAAITEPGLKAHLLRLQARWLSCRLERWHLSRADTLIAVSRSVRDELAGAYGIAPERVTVIPNGVDLDRFADPSPDGERRHLLYVGRLGYRKGLFRLLDAFARADLPDDTHLLLAGEGPLRDRLAEHGRKLGLGGRLRFLGFLDRRGLVAALRDAAGFVNPADYESGPLTLLEAMASRTPVVSTPTGLAAELGVDPPILLSRPTPESLARAMSALFADPEATAERARQARRLVEREFGWERVVDRLEAAYGLRARLAA